MSSSASSSTTPHSANLRLLADFRSLQSDAPEGISASPVSDDNMFIWEATIVGPDETPWEGGIFSLTIRIPPNYPDRPPNVRFTTEMFHPNVFEDGNLCLDIIQDQWKPIYTIGTVLTSIQSLLTDPNCSSPANTEAAKLFQKDPKEYARKVRKCAQKSVGM
mmetsp:Transcript_39123/g.97914  ORF Transcript_39123/g.97914 Transcript_39123/m.97914 type:complete len:162 (+) Transcript_39123:106-591(+)